MKLKERIPTPYGRSIGPGWKNLVEPLIEKCREEGVEILQVKEKFGGLRFYIDDGAASWGLKRAIDKAEQDSITICEQCGKEGDLRPLGWIKTLCDDCYEVERRATNA
jgi:NMD protein affecting ribosome stability and mRNA decay